MSSFIDSDVSRMKPRAFKPGILSEDRGAYHYVRDINSHNARVPDSFEEIHERNLLKKMEEIQAELSKRELDTKVELECSWCGRKFFVQSVNARTRKYCTSKCKREMFKAKHHIGMKRYYRELKNGTKVYAAVNPQ